MINKLDDTKLRGAALVAFLGAGVLLLLVSQDVFVSFDRKAFSSWTLNGAWYHLLFPFSLLGTILVLLCLMPIFQSWKERLRIGFAFCCLEFLELLGKVFFVQPAGDLKQVVLGWHFSYSLPSGHAMRAAFLAVLFIFLIRKVWPLAVLTLGFLSWALVATHAHYPSDVLVGLLLGSAVGFTLVSFLPKRSNLQPSAETAF